MQNFSQQCDLCATLCAPAVLVSCCSALAEAEVALIDLTISPLCAAAVRVWFDDGTVSGTGPEVFDGELVADTPCQIQAPNKEGFRGGDGRPLVAAVTAGGPVKITGWYYHVTTQGTTTEQEDPA